MGDLASIIVIPSVWGEGVRRSIESAAGQSYDPVEIIVVDAGGAGGRARGVLGGLGGARPVRVADALPGLPGAWRNAGVAASHGSFIVCVEEGDEIRSDFCAEAIQSLEATGAAYAVAPSLMNPGDAPLVPEFPAQLDSRAVAGATWCAPAALMFRRSAWDAVGGFDEALETLEHYDFLLRFSRSGMRGAVLERPGLRQPAARETRYRQALEPESYRAGVRAIFDRHRPLFEADPAAALFGRERLLRELVGMHRERVARRDDHVERVRRTVHEIGRIRTFLQEEGRDGFEWGDANRTSPVSRNWGYDRGTPVDRYYIGQFVERHAADVRGVVLEVQENDLTIRAGGARVTRSDILDINPGNPRATVIGDLRRLAGVPGDSYDCVILTQTLHVIDDTRQVVAECRRILKPGGVLLATLPCASRVCLEYGPDGDFWRVTEAGARALFGEVFPAARVQARSFGNVQVITAFLMGLACQEIDPEVFEVHDPYFPLLVGVRAVKPTAADVPEQRGRSGRIARSHAGAILMYHRVADPPASDVHGLCVRPDEFGRQMAALRQRFHPMALIEFVEAARRGELPEGAVAVTFDDGYLDALTTAQPILETHGIPATFFLTSDRLAVEHEFWWDTLERVLLGPGGLPVSLAVPSVDGARSINIRTADERRAAFWELYRVLQSQPAEARAQGIAQVLAWSKAGAAPRPGARPMTLDEIRTLVANPALTIGAHGAHHDRLPVQPEDTQRADVAECKRVLEEVVGRAVTAFSYPFGAWSARTARIVRQAGFALAVTCDDEPVRAGGDPWRLPRLDVKPHAGPYFERRLRAFLDRD